MAECKRKWTADLFKRKRTNTFSDQFMLNEVSKILGDQITLLISAYLKEHVIMA